MMDSSDFVVVFITTGTREQAESIARHCIEEKLAACANIIDGCSSVYAWKGNVETAREALMIVKTAKSLFPELARRVTELHGYDVPEIIALPLTHIADGYLGYLVDTLSGTR